MRKTFSTRNRHLRLFCIIGDANAMRMPVSGGSGTTAIDNMATTVRKQQGIYNLKGKKVAGLADDLYKLPKGIYIIEGTKVLK